MALSIEQLVDLSEFAHAALLRDGAMPWSALGGALADYLASVKD